MTHASSLVLTPFRYPSSQHNEDKKSAKCTVIHIININHGRNLLNAKSLKNQHKLDVKEEGSSTKLTARTI